VWVDLDEVDDATQEDWPVAELEHSRTSTGGGMWSVVADADALVGARCFWMLLLFLIVPALVGLHALLTADTRASPRGRAETGCDVSGSKLRCAISSDATTLRSGWDPKTTLGEPSPVRR
jgi:hypothetical protein